MVPHCGSCLIPVFPTFYALFSPDVSSDSHVARLVPSPLMSRTLARDLEPRRCSYISVTPVDAHPVRVLCSIPITSGVRQESTGSTKYRCPRFSSSPPRTGNLSRLPIRAASASRTRIPCQYLKATSRVFLAPSALHMRQCAQKLLLCGHITLQGEPALHRMGTID